MTLKDALGNTYNPTGQNLFVGAFSLYQQMGRALPVDPGALSASGSRTPTSADVGNVVAGSGDAIDVSITALVTGGAVAAGDRIRVRMYNICLPSNPSGSRKVVATSIMVPTGTPVAFDPTVTLFPNSPLALGDWAARSMWYCSLPTENSRFWCPRSCLSP